MACARCHCAGAEYPTSSDGSALDRDSDSQAGIMVVPDLEDACLPPFLWCTVQNRLRCEFPPSLARCHASDSDSTLGRVTRTLQLNPTRNAPCKAKARRASETSSMRACLREFLLREEPPADWERAYFDGSRRRARKPRVTAVTKGGAHSSSHWPAGPGDRPFKLCTRLLKLHRRRRLH